MQRDTTHNDIDGLGRGSVEGPAAPEALIDALGMAFSTFTLYEDPTSVEAFDRAIAILSHAPAFPWRAEVGVDGFSLDGEPVAIRRDGSVRLSRGLFGLGIAAIDFTAAPSADDLLEMLRLLGAGDPPDDPDAVLYGAGVHSIRLLDRAMFLATGRDADDDDYAGIAMTPTDDSPAAFVLRMMEDGDQAPQAVAARFVEEYERAHLLVDFGDTWGTEELVHAFVDGFWFLPEAHRAEIFSLMLERGHRIENTSFLDQFGGIELAAMNQMFGSEGHPLLSEYLRVASEEGGRHSDDLGELVTQDHVQSLTSRIVDQVASVLHTRTAGGPTRPETAIDRLGAAHPDSDDARRSTSNVLGGLLSLADATDGFHATAQVWASRVVAALASEDFQSADDWINAVAGLRLSSEARTLLLKSLAAAAKGPAVDTLANLLTLQTMEGPGSTIRKAAPLFAVDGLVRELGDEAGAGRRKTLLKALQVVARLRPQSLLPHLTDPRWFVVRNVVVAIGTSRRPDMAGHVQVLSSHADHRVRLEALRAIYRLDGDASVPLLLERLSDDHQAVTAEAGRLLAGISAPGIDGQLAQRVASGGLDEALAAIGALQWRTTPAARTCLASLARKRLAWGKKRRLRTAARNALEAHE